MAKQKIGFIFLDDIHHIHHFISVFAELHKQNKYDIDIITFDAKQEYLIKLLKLFKIQPSVIRPFSTFHYRKILNYIRRRKQPNHVFIFKKNKKEFLKYDMLVYNVFQHQYLLKQRKNLKPKFVFLGHGSGDRGRDYIDNDKVSPFDLIAVSGEKKMKFFKDSTNFATANIKICGYLKFDATKIENKNQKLFKNDNPVILYNPHFQSGLSSFHKDGYKVLDFFIKNNNFNLIFAPHINLFNKKRSLKKGEFDKKYLNVDNILIDFGSIKSVNMYYTLNSDIYLGDVSSQVYEFLIKLRPCIFLNSYNIDWIDNKHYENWHLGKVITEVIDLEKILKSRNLWQKEFVEKQKMAMDYTFDMNNKVSPSERVAKEITKLL